MFEVFFCVALAPGPPREVQEIPDSKVSSGLHVPNQHHEQAEAGGQAFSEPPIQGNRAAQDSDNLSELLLGGFLGSARSAARESHGSRPSIHVIMPLQALQDVDAMTPGGTAAGLNRGDAGKAPKDFRPMTDVPLSPTAVEAVRMSETCRGGPNSPAAGPDGRVLYAEKEMLEVFGRAELK